MISSYHDSQEKAILTYSKTRYALVTSKCECYHLLHKQVRNKRLGELNTMKNKEKKKKQSLAEKAKLFVKDYRRQLPLQMMVIPGIIFMIIFCYMPIYGLTIAFKSLT